MTNFERLLNDAHHPVDLIVVSANSLRAKDLKKSLSEVAKSASRPISIYGSPEVPKLFASSHNSEVLHPGMT